MKKIIFLVTLSATILVFSSFKNETSMHYVHVNVQDAKGSELFHAKGCALCHAPEKQIVGPSLKEIANAYKGDVNKVLEFMNQKRKPIVNPEEFKYMQPVLGELKRMKPEERKALATYYMSFYKK